MSDNWQLTNDVPSGRKNWNIPKQLASFKFFPREGAVGPSDLPYSRVEVFDPNKPDTPFFAVDLRPTMFFSKARIPFNAKYIPFNQDIAHPPLPQSPNWKQDALVGTDEWNVVPWRVYGKAGLMRSSGGLPGGNYGDNEGFPDVQPWSLGMWLRDFGFTIPVGEHFTDKKV